ncbi:hypothetical protein [Sphingomonas sp. YL-JM2C]
MASTPNIEFIRDAEIRASLDTIEKLFSSGLMAADEVAVLMAGVTQTLILLNDLLQKADDDGMRIAFNDDIDPAWGADITAFVRAMRNAACHVSSALRDFQGNRFAFNVIYGQQAFIINDVAIGCDYADDIAINYGGMRLYVERHLRRATDEVAAALMPRVDAGMTQGFAWAPGGR